jgi:hypothetical protein
MATEIFGLNNDQIHLLWKAFGWESYPNGNSGHPRGAEEWMRKNGFVPEILYPGSIAGTREIRFTNVVFTEAQTAERVELARQHR